jgi:glycerol-1-phosphate dehydrogenase [NAD(P)+]
LIPGAIEMLHSGRFATKPGCLVIETPDGDLIERAKSPVLRIGRDVLAAQIAALAGRYALLTQPEPAAFVDPTIAGRAAATVMVGSLAAADLETLVAGLPDVDRVVGIGGGMTLDAAKYVAWRRGIPLVLAPSIVSVDAAVTNTIAVRDGGRVEYRGFVVAEVIVADLALIGRAPARLNRAGVGDLLSIHTALWDWRAGAAAGKVAFDAALADRSAAVLAQLYDLAVEISAVSDRALEAVLRGYVEVNALCLTAGHSGPEEGSEHYFGYRLEAVTGRSFVHGELIGLGSVLMAALQANEPGRVATFLDRAGVGWRPAEQGLGRAVLREALTGLPAFVREAGLPYSIIDEADLGPDAVERLLDGVPAPAGVPAGGS